MFYWSPASFSWFIFKFVKDNILTSVISSFTIKHIVLLWITLSVLMMATCQKQLPEVFSVRLRPSFSPEVIHMCSFRISIKLDCLCLSVEPAKLGRIWYNSPSKIKLTPSPARTFLKFLTPHPPSHHRTGRRISQNITLWNIPVHDVINVSYYEQWI